MREPILFLPLRIETSFDESARAKLLVHIRAWPDQIHVDALRRSVSEEERRLLATHERHVAAGEADALDRLAHHVGTGRARWLTARDRHRTLPDDAGHAKAPPMARGLPARLRFSVTARRVGTVSVLGEAIPDELPLAPPLDAGQAELAFSGQEGDPVRWLSDFPTAVQLGMAASVELPLDAGRGWSEITAVAVTGIPRDAPEEDQARLQALLEAHAGSGGLGLLRMGAPTKGPRAPTPGTEDAATAVERALGLERGTFAPDDRAGLDQAQVLCAELVWSAAVRPALIDGWLMRPGEGLVRDPAELDAWRDRFTRDLRPAGRFPAIVAGAQPYGLHVMRPPDARGRGPLAALAARAVERFAAQASAVEATRRAMGPWEALIAALCHPAASDTVRLRRTHPLVATLNLALDPGSAPAGTIARARTERRARAEALGLWRPDDGPRAALDVLYDPKARHLDLPLVSEDGEDAAPGTGPRLSALLDLPLADLFASRRSDTVMELLALAALRQSVLQLAAALDAPDEAAAAEALGRHDDYSADPIDIRAFVIRRLEVDWRDGSVRALIEAVEPRARDRTPGGRAVRELLRLDKVFRSLDAISPTLLARCLPAALDAASHRIDAWEEADAAAALVERRGTVRGLHLSAYGRLEGVDRLGAVAPVYRLAPSLAHAATAGLLEQARDDARDDGRPPVPVELSAARTAEGIALARRLREAGDMDEALAALALDEMARHGRADLASALAAAFPHRDGLRADAAPQADTVPRLDALGLAEAVARENLPAMDLPLEEIARTIAPRLLEALAGYHDLHLAEGAHLLANGRPDAARGAFEAMAGGGLPPERFEVAELRPATAAVAHHVVLAVADPATNADPGARGLDRVAPVAGALAARLLGQPVGEVFVTLAPDPADPASGTTRLTLPLVDLAPTALEWAMAARPGHRWIELMRVAVRLRLAKTGETRPIIRLRPSFAATDWLWLCERAGAALTEGRALAPSDLDPEAAETPALDATRQGAARALLDAVDAALAAPRDAAGTMRLAFRLATHGRPGPAARLLDVPDDVDAVAAEVAAWSRGARSTLADDPAAALDALFPDLPVAPALPFASPADAVPPDADAAAARDWLDGAQRVRDRLAPLADALAAGADARLGATVVQRHDGAGLPGGWVATARAPGDFDGTAHTLLMLHPGEAAPAAAAAGFLLDRWREELPEAELELGLALRAEVPPGRAANAMLLCVLDEDGPPLDALDGVVDHAFAQMKARTITLATLPPAKGPDPTAEPFADLGGLLPLLWLPMEPVEDPAL